MTGISTISTSQQSLAMRQLIARQNADMAKLSKEAASGMREDVYKSSPGLAAGSLEMRSKMAENDSYMDSNKLLQGKLDVTADVMTSIREMATEFQTLSLGGSISESNRDVYRQQAELTLERLADALNTTYRGEYLFSGLATDTKPVEIDPSGESVTYLGDTAGNLSSRIDGETELNYGIRADNTAFTEIFYALEQVLSTDMDALDVNQFETFIGGVTDSMNNGLKDLLSEQASLGSNQNMLQDKIDAQMALRNIYNSSIVDIESVNMEETAMRLQAVTLQLETTYSITSRMSGMSLLNYL